jgi:hypothetical protein
MKKNQKATEEQRKFLRRIGRKGGKNEAGAGGRATLESMTPAARIARAYNAGKQGGHPVVIDHARVHELRERGLKWREIADEMGISIASVARILKERK